MSEWQHAEGDGDAFDDLREWAAADDAVKKHLCDRVRGIGDREVNAVVRERFGGGKLAEPFIGHVRTHALAALALALTYGDTKGEPHV